jgi:NitT/TauT family transport system ATP-binding protein
MTVARAPAISLAGVVKEYPLRGGQTVRALDGIDLEIASGEFVALIGPSGCGKSTVLRLIAALEVPTAGTVTVEGQDPAVLARAHRLGVAFQDHALLPWLSAWDNVALPFHVAECKVDAARVRALLDMVGMAGFERARPRQLSGGMCQRVAIARALALQPDVLLLDEPFGALDAVTRRRLNLELQRIWADHSPAAPSLRHVTLGPSGGPGGAAGRSITTLLVTHSVDEAVFLADRVVVLSSRPGTVRTITQVPFPRPRGRELLTSPAFHDLVDRLTLALDQGQGPQPEAPPPAVDAPALSVRA